MKRAPNGKRKKFQDDVYFFKANKIILITRTSYGIYFKSLFIFWSVFKLFDFKCRNFQPNRVKLASTWLLIIQRTSSDPKVNENSASSDLLYVLEHKDLSTNRAFEGFLACFILRQMYRFKFFKTKFDFESNK